MALETLRSMMGVTTPYIGPGMLMAAGMEPHHPQAGAVAGTQTFGMGPARLDTVHGMPTNIRMVGKPETGAIAGVGRLAQGAGMVFSPMMGYASGGVRGAVEATVGNIALDSALYRFHYANSPKSVAGTIVRPGLVSGWGGNAALGTRAFNTLAFAGKYVGGGAGGWAGSVLGGKVGSVFGGPGELVGSVAGTFGGAYLGAGAISALSTPVGAGVAAVGAGLAVGTAVTAGTAAAVGYGTYQTLRAGYRYRQMQKGIHTSGNLAAFHTQNAATMRSRAVQSIAKSHLNARSALGQEASLMHMSSRNYHSKYRR